MKWELPKLPDARYTTDLYDEEQMVEYARMAVRRAVDDMTDSIVNFDLPIECEDAADWLEKWASVAKPHDGREEVK